MTRRKTAGEKSLEIDAIAKNSDDRGLREGFSGIGDAEIGSEERDEVSSDDLLGLKAMKQLVVRISRERGRRRPGKRRRTGGEGEIDRERRQGADDEEAGIFYFYLRSRGRKHG